MTKNWTMAGLYTSDSFPKETVLMVELCGGEARYTWELRNGSRQECSPKFVEARKHTWKWRAI